MIGALAGVGASAATTATVTAFQSAEQARMAAEGMAATRIANDNTVISAALQNAKGISF